MSNERSLHNLEHFRCTLAGLEQDEACEWFIRDFISDAVWLMPLPILRSLAELILADRERELKQESDGN